MVDCKEYYASMFDNEYLKSGNKQESTIYYKFASDLIWKIRLTKKIYKNLTKIIINDLFIQICINKKKKLIHFVLLYLKNGI